MKSPPAKELHKATHLLWPCSYALAITPLIRKLKENEPETKEIWYADDASGAGTCLDLRKWWDCVTALGPRYGYFPKSSKTHLVVKPDFEEHARSLSSCKVGGGIGEASDRAPTAEKCIKTQSEAASIVRQILELNPSLWQVEDAGTIHDDSHTEPMI